MRVDADVSLCDRSRFTYSWMDGAGPQMQRDFSAGDISLILSRNRFAGAILAGQLNEPAETEWLLELASSHPVALGVLSAAHSSPSLWDTWMSRPGFLGIANAPAPLAPEIAARNLACTMSPDAALSALEAAPGLRVAIRATFGREDWGAAAFEPWRPTMDRLATESQAPVIVSGLINRAFRESGGGGWQAETYRPWVQYLFARFGPGRLIYGSGWPFCMETGTWKEELACFTQCLGAQTMETREQILGANAARWLGLRYTE